MSERPIYDLDAAMAPRKTIDANWSTKKKAIVGTLAGVLGVAAASAGIWFATQSGPLPMPGNAEEAITGMTSARFDRMSDERQSAYRAEAARLMRDMSREERRALFQNEETRAAMERLMQERMAEMVRAMARGETPEWMRGMGGGRPERAERPEGERPAQMARPDPAQMRDRITSQFATGDAQTGSLMGEMFKRGQRGGWRGGGGRGR
ncbi:MAG: hypothetical protein EA379_09845 [Phycisphaerales bacterium]|nr:MAG: hypothetical protein EA379_09845 [Phycisphaerales bacterium]